MKTLITLFLILLWAGSAGAFPPGLVAGMGGANIPFCVGTEPYCQTFEANDTCTVLGFTIQGPADCQYTTDVIDSYGLVFPRVDAATTAYNTTNFTGTNPAYTKFSFKISNSSSGTNYILFGKTTTSDRWDLRISSGAIKMAWADQLQSTGYSIANDTWYTVKVRTQKDVSNDGAIAMWVGAGKNAVLSTDLGDSVQSVTGLDGNYTSDMTGFRFGSTVNGVIVVVDNIKVKGSDPDA